MSISHARARASRVCVCGKSPLINFERMEQFITLFEKFGYSVALSVTLLIFGYRLINRHIKYLQDTIKELSSIIAKNTEIYKLLYDYLTKK